MSLLDAIAEIENEWPSEFVCCDECRPEYGPGFCDEPGDRIGVILCDKHRPAVPRLCAAIRVFEERHRQVPLMDSEETGCTCGLGNPCRTLAQAEAALTGKEG